MNVGHATIILHIYIDIFMQHRKLHMALSNTSTQDVNLANTIREARKKQQTLYKQLAASEQTYIKSGQQAK